jgi:hypothetical protein
MSGVEPNNRSGRRYEPAVETRWSGKSGYNVIRVADGEPQAWTRHEEDARFLAFQGPPCPRCSRCGAFQWALEGEQFRCVNPLCTANPDAVAAAELRREVERLRGGIDRIRAAAGVDIGCDLIATVADLKADAVGLRTELSVGPVIAGLLTEPGQRVSVRNASLTGGLPLFVATFDTRDIEQPPRAPLLDGIGSTVGEAVQHLFEEVQRTQ